MKAMILAAGLGTRLHPYTALRPKPLFPILGRPLLLSLIERLRESGFTSIIVNIHHLSQQIIGLLENEKDIVLQVEPTILGTGGGLRMASEHFAGEPVLVTNGDIFHNIDYGKIYRQHLSASSMVSMVMHDFKRFNKVFVNSDGLVCGFPGSESRSVGQGELLAFTGIHVLEPEILTGIPRNRFYSIIDLYSTLASQREVQAIKLEKLFWQDIGTPTDYLDLHAYLLKKQNNMISSGLQRIPGSQFWTGADVAIGRNVQMRDWGVIGAGAQIGDNSILQRVVVWDGTYVDKNSNLHDTIVC